MQFPYQRSGQKEQREIGNDVAESVDIIDVVSFDWAFSPGVELYTQDPTRFDGSAGEDAEEKGDSRPDGEDSAEDPGRHAVGTVDAEDAIEEYEKGQLRKREANSMEVASYDACLCRC